jgi:hypothetical protein
MNNEAEVVVTHNDNRKNVRMFSANWNTVSPNAVPIHQNEINKWVDEMVKEMIAENSHLLARVCGDTIVTIFREDEDEDYFSVEVAKRVSTAYVRELERL